MYEDVGFESLASDDKKCRYPIEYLHFLCKYPNFEMLRPLGHFLRGAHCTFRLILAYQFLSS